MDELTRRRFLQQTASVGAGLTLAASALGQQTRPATTRGTAWQSRFDRMPDRVWLGAELWANPMEEWVVREGRIECTSIGGDRNVHLLTHQLARRPGRFRMAVQTGTLEADKAGSTGFRVGIHDQVNDYRGNCFWGQGVDAGIGNGQLVLGEASQPLARESSLRDVQLELTAAPYGNNKHRLTLKAVDHETGEDLGTLSQDVPADALIGNVALVNNFGPRNEEGSRFWFREWQVEGDKFDVDPDRAFGPVLWSMYTLSNSRGPEGYQMKLTAQMPPLGEKDSDVVEMQIRRGDEWQTLGTQRIHPDARTATFSAGRWDQSIDTPYRLLWTQVFTDGARQQHERTGTIRKEPEGQPLVLGGMTCQQHMGFPYGPVAENLAKVDPDVLFFSGDQLYEENGHYGFVRFPAEPAILCYLRKWYMFGWAFGEVMRDRPTLCIPDDHDVFQANIWGKAGERMPPSAPTSSHGGYIEPVRMIEVVHTTNCGHHPTFYDPAPVKRGISVYYGDMVYGRTSFAIISDRQWKSGPEEVRPDDPRRDWIPEGYDISTLDQPGLVLLGDRQEQFLEHWVQDWRGADMKVLLSETLFANVVTHHGTLERYLQADLDSGGWPQTARNTAVRIARKGFPLHVNGDQHLASLVQYGVDDFRDSFWSFCTPAVSVGYQRWWLPDEVGRSHTDRPEHGLANTGKYRDGLNHPTYVYAVANPPGSRHPNRYTRADIKASGFGIIRIDPQERTYTMEGYRFLADLDADPDNAQFPGWPLTIPQSDNYGRRRVGYLPRVQSPGGADPVVKIMNEETNQLVYALRIQGESFEPFVFEDGRYTVHIGDPDRDQWKIIENQTIARRVSRAESQEL